MQLPIDNENEPKIIGYLWKVSKDHDGECLLQLKIPSLYQHYAMNLPEKVNFEIIFKEWKEKI